MDFLQNKFFLIALTFGFYLGAQLLQKRTGIRLLNPILLAIAAMIAFLLMCDIDYDTYKREENTLTSGSSLPWLPSVYLSTSSFRP